MYALLADGRTVEIRPATERTSPPSRPCTRRCRPNNAYLRFFSLSRLAAEQEARRVTREPGPDHAALLALYDGQVVGLASYEVTPADGSRTAEVAFAVADTMHHRGIATLLLEHLVSLARARQLEALTAETLPENTGMLRVFSDAGLPVVSKREEGVVAITIPLPPDDTGTAARGLPGHGGGPRAVRQRGQPPAGVRARLGRGDRGEQANRDGRPVGPRQHQGRRIRGAALRGEPETPRRGRSAASPASPTWPSLPEAPDLAVLAVPPAAVVGDRRGLRAARRARPGGAHRRRRRAGRRRRCSPSAAGTGCG